MNLLFGEISILLFLNVNCTRALRFMQLILGDFAFNVDNCTIMQKKHYKFRGSLMVHISRGFCKVSTSIQVDERKFFFDDNTASNISGYFFTFGVSTEHDFFNKSNYKSGMIFLNCSRVFYSYKTFFRESVEVNTTKHKSNSSNSNMTIAMKFLPEAFLVHVDVSFKISS